MSRRIVSILIVSILVSLTLMLTGSGQPFNTDVILIIDRSGSMNDPMAGNPGGPSKFTLITRAGGYLNTALTSLDARLTNTSEITFWVFGGGCTPNDVDVLVNWQAKPAAIPAIRVARPAAGGFPKGTTPFDELIKKLSNEIQNRLRNRPGFLMGYWLLSDGIPTCANGAGAGEAGAKAAALAAARNAFGNVKAIKDAIDQGRLKGTLEFYVPKFLKAASMAGSLNGENVTVEARRIGDMLVSRGYKVLGQGRYLLPASATVHYAQMPQAPTPELEFAEALAGEMIADLLVAETEEEAEAITQQAIASLADPSFPPNGMKICGVKNLGGIMNVSAIIDDGQQRGIGNGNGIIEAGETVVFHLVVNNKTDQTYHDLWVSDVEMVRREGVPFLAIPPPIPLGDLPPYGRVWTGDELNIIAISDVSTDVLVSYAITIESPDFGIGVVEFTFKSGTQICW
jgi:hypothetical protein